MNVEAPLRNQNPWCGWWVWNEVKDEINQ